MSKLVALGWDKTETKLPPDVFETLRESLFQREIAGTRCVLDIPVARLAAILLREMLVSQQVLSSAAIAVQAIAFDKTPATNWKVTWHQDLMFPLASKPTAPGFALPTIKDGVNYARPPAEVLAAMLAVRLHLDRCDESNGPLRISPGTHRGGILRSSDINALVERYGQQVCVAQAGESVLLRPLLLHASSPAQTPGHRRVLHVVYYDGPPCAEQWHRSI